jgi:pyruvate carboxylase
MAPADLDTLREEADAIAARPVSDEEFNSYLMYPKVFSDYIGFTRQYGPVAVLPTSTFFYGMAVGEEITVDIEPGKTLIISCQAVGETEEDGNVKVFFELNGQPRAAKVPYHAAADALPERRRAEPGNDGHVAAPMPGMVASVSVTEGQRVSAGDMLLTIEAMKMETAIHAERDGVVQSIVAPHGTQVDAKDLLIELAPIDT